MTSEICVCIPAFNASETIGEVIKRASKYVSKIIVVDDGSNDNTAKIAIDAGADVIVMRRNKGKGDALKRLFKQSIGYGYKAVICMDADGQHDPDNIPDFLKAHISFPSDIIVGSRMHEKEKIPRNRYNSMHIARFYVSLAANQYIEDTQCGFRLYPLELINRICLTTNRYVTETEILIKAGSMGLQIRFVNIRTIYNNNNSHFRPIMDIAAITSYVILFLHIKWFIEGLTSKKYFIYSHNNIIDKITRINILKITCQSITVISALPASLLFLMEYILLSPVINNYSVIRKLDGGFFKITQATHMLPFLIIIAMFDKIFNLNGTKVNFLDRIIERFYSSVEKNSTKIQC